MRILLIHNAYARPSGEEEAIRRLTALLESRSHVVASYERSSAELVGVRTKLIALGSSLHSFRSKAEVAEIMDRFRPDIVQIQNVYPLISPSVLDAAWERRIPIVMRCPNYRLTCPIGLHLNGGAVCTRCVEGGEHWCALKNCAGEWSKSVGYALRAFTARVSGAFPKRVSQFIVLSEFQRRWFIDHGLPEDRISVLPNVPERVTCDVAPSDGRYVAYVGRLSREKGIDTLLAAAALLPDVPFRIAGEGAPPGGRVPPNVEFCGYLSGARLQEFYAGMTMLICPSVCFEGFPGVIGEAMRFGKPVVCSRIGGLPEVVLHETTGLTVEPGAPEPLAAAIRRLWSDASLSCRFGETGAQRLVAEYAPDRFYAALMSVYQRARLSRGCDHHEPVRERVIAGARN